MPAIVTTGRVFHHHPPSLWTFLSAGFESPHIRRIFSPFSSEARGLNHSAILLRCPQIWSMPAIVTTGRVFQHHPPSLWTFLASGFESPHIRRIFSPFSSEAWGLNHSAILLPPPLNLVYASHSNDGTCFTSPSAQPMDFFGSRIRTSAYPAYI